MYPLNSTFCKILLLLHYVLFIYQVLWGVMRMNAPFTHYRTEFKDLKNMIIVIHNSTTQVNTFFLIAVELADRSEQRDFFKSLSGGPTI